MRNISVNLQPLITNLNLPTVIKTAYLPGDTVERLFIATQVGEIYYLGNGTVEPFLNITDQVIELGTRSGGYDERGLLGLAFHPNFHNNGLFYIHYSVAGSQGAGALEQPFSPDPCDINTLNLSWQDRENRFDHIDTVEEWTIMTNNTGPEKLRTILNLRRPFMNHNGVNSLTFSPETAKLILATGDGGSAYDPFNLSQSLMEIAGKIIEIDVDINTNIQNPPVVSRFNELPTNIQETLTVIAKGIRNSTGLVYQWNTEQFVKYIGQVGQDLVESIYLFTYYMPIAVRSIVENDLDDIILENEGFINLGWRGWEGDLPTALLSPCPNNSSLNRKTIAYYDEVVELSSKRIYPVVSYFHEDPRLDKFEGSALTGVCPYMGNEIPELSESIVFSDFMKRNGDEGPGQGALGFTRVRPYCYPPIILLYHVRRKTVLFSIAYPQLLTEYLEGSSENAFVANKMSDTPIKRDYSYFINALRAFDSSTDTNIMLKKLSHYSAKVNISDEKIDSIRDSPLSWGAKFIYEILRQTDVITNETEVPMLIIHHNRNAHNSMNLGCVCDVVPVVYNQDDEMFNKMFVELVDSKHDGEIFMDQVDEEIRKCSSQYTARVPPIVINYHGTHSSQIDSSPFKVFVDEKKAEQQSFLFLDFDIHDNLISLDFNSAEKNCEKIGLIIKKILILK